MKLDMNYSVSARDVLTNPEMGARFDMMRRAGVNRVWLEGYFYGHHETAPEDIARARTRILDAGFESGIISLPVGHPGNSLNPDDPTLALRIPDSWRYRIDKNGNPVYFCADIDGTMIRDNTDAARVYAQMGFDMSFFDDDLRMGNWGKETQGCFCDDCISRFNERFSLKETRDTLRAYVEGAPDPDGILNMWRKFNCDKVTDMMVKTHIDGQRSGIMVMHDGDERHGISIPDIRRALPDCMFRVGEAHFSDADYAVPGGRASVAKSISHHLKLIGDCDAYSESTVFPARALSPENLLDKIRLEISLGLRHIFLMAGTWFLSEPYWKAIADNREALSEFAAALDEAKEK